MPTTTSRLGLLNPIGSDLPSEIRLGSTTNYATLDGAVTITEGVFSSRPAGSYYGQTYYATDALGGLGLWYFYTGTAWETVMLAGSWTALPLNTNWTSGTAGTGYTAAWRIVGDKVELAGYVTNAAGFPQGAPFTTLPTAIRPTDPVNVGVSYVGASTGVTSMLIIGGTAGTNVDIPASCQLYLDGISYRLI
jgi:hypothetical protein